MGIYKEVHIGNILHSSEVQLVNYNKKLPACVCLHAVMAHAQLNNYHKVQNVSILCSLWSTKVMFFNKRFQIIIITSFAPISSKIKLSGATKPRD